MTYGQADVSLEGSRLPGRLPICVLPLFFFWEIYKTENNAMMPRATETTTILSKIKKKQMKWILRKEGTNHKHNKYNIFTYPILLLISFGCIMLHFVHAACSSFVHLFLFFTFACVGWRHFTGHNSTH